MSTPHETTSLLHNGHIRDVVGVDRVASADPPHLENPTKILTLGDPGTDLEASEVVPCTSNTTEPPEISTSSLIQVVAVLMIGRPPPLLIDYMLHKLTIVKGLFTSNIDSSLILATHPRIASEFNALEDSSWLFVGFLLAGVATQVLVSMHTCGCQISA